MSELELKLRVPDDALPSLRDALRAHGARTTRLQAHYFDTADGRLALHRVALRLRREGGHWVQALKAAGDGAAHRLEHEVRVSGTAAAMPAIELSRHDRSDAKKALDAALLATPPTTLIERHATDVTRLHALVHDARGGTIEVALDIGSVSANARSVPIAELELEHKGGPLQGLFELAASWVRHGGLWLCTTTKAERGQRLLLPEAQSHATKARAPQLSRHADGPALMRALLQSALEQVLANASDLADGLAEADTIHQLRVGLRRLRTVLRELKALSPAVPADWDRVLGEVFGQLGLRRDQQVVAAAVRPLLTAVSAPQLSWSRRSAPDPVAAVRATEFQTTLIAILALAHGEADRFAALSSSAARKLLARRLEALHRTLAQEGQRFEQATPEAQHRTRKRLKRLRYLSELTASLWPQRARQRYLDRLVAAQDALGHHTDVGVAAAAFRIEAREQPEAWFAAGYLLAHLAVTARVARKALRGVAGAEVFWR